jgi:hypothetical protein
MKVQVEKTTEETNFRLDLSPAEACILIHEISVNPRYKVGLALQKALTAVLPETNDHDEICRCKLCQGKSPQRTPSLKLEMPPVIVKLIQKLKSEYPDF